MYSPLLDYLNRLGEIHSKPLKKLLSKPTPLFTVAETAVLTNTSQALWRKLIYNGQVEYFKVGGRLQIPLDAIAKHIEHYPSFSQD